MAEVIETAALRQTGCYFGI